MVLETDLCKELSKYFEVAGKLTANEDLESIALGRRWTEQLGSSTTIHMEHVCEWASDDGGESARARIVCHWQRKCLSSHAGSLPNTLWRTKSSTVERL